MLRRACLIVALLLVACNIEPRHAIGPKVQVAHVFVTPDTVTINPLATQQFAAYGRTEVGDSVPVSVQWSASAGTITQSALFTADSSENDVTVTASMTEQLAGAAASTLLTGSAVVHKHTLVAIVLTPAAVPRESTSPRCWSRRARGAG